MSNPLSYGLNLKKKSGNAKTSAPQRRPIFGEDADSDNDTSNPEVKSESIAEIGGAAEQSSGSQARLSASKSTARGTRVQPPDGQPRPKRADPTGLPSQLGDLSSALMSRKYAEEAEKEDPLIYDYDAAYDLFKAPARNAASGNGPAGAERKSQYMTNLKKMAEVRERDRKIAEDKKMKREREAEGDEFADKEKFVTVAYKQQQEENRRLEEEERHREEEEARKNKSGGMTGFYKQLLDRDDQRRAEMAKAAELLQQKGRALFLADEGSKSQDKEKIEAEIAMEINKQGGSVAINEEGQVVDKRELLRGGLNLVSKKKPGVPREEARREDDAASERRKADRGYFDGGYFDGGRGGKQAMRDRQSRMLEAQYEQALKRSREEAEEERKKVELASKSRKTATDISSAKERYLARKKAEAEAKAAGLLGDP